MKLGPSLKLRRMAYRSRLLIAPLAVILLAPLAAHAQGSPFDNGFTALQTLFTGTIAKVASLIAIVIGGYQFAHGEPGGKKAFNLFNTTPDDSTIQLFDLAITTAAPAGCPYVVGLSSEEGERRSIYLLNNSFLRIKPKETLPIERTSYFAIKPYSNQLWSGAYKPITAGTTESTFSRIDLDKGLGVILSKMDALLDPEAIKTLKRDQLEKLLFNKKRLVESELKMKTANIDSPGESGQEELRKEFRDLLLENLGNFVRYDGIVSMTPVSIGLGALEDHRVSISLEKHDNYTLRSSKIDFRESNPKWFVLFDQIKDSPFIDLDLQPRITHVEFDIEPDAASPEIERSTWIQLIKPIELGRINTIQTVPDKKWPRILREFPPVPLLLNHTAEQVTPDSGTLTWDKGLGQWKYVLSVLDRYKDLDRVNVEIKATSIKRLLATEPVRNFKGFIAFWSTLILDEKRKFVPDEFINDLDYQLALHTHDAENIFSLTQPNSFTIERQGGIWSLIANATPYDVHVQKDGAAINMVIGGKGFNLFEIGDRIKSITSKTTAFRNRRANNDAFVYVTDTVEPATAATPHIAFFTPIRLHDGELLQFVYARLKAMNLPYKSTAKLLVNVADLDAHRDVTLPIIPIRQMEFKAGSFPANTAFDTTFDRYRNGFPSISVTIYNEGGDLSDLPIFNAVNIFTKVK
jgi:type IV secretion system protein VirB2